MKRSKAGQGPEYWRDLVKGLPLKRAAVREKLREKGKRQKQFRIYSLYGHRCHPMVLAAAWQQVGAGKGAPGEDGMGLEDWAAARKAFRVFWRGSGRNW